MGKKAGETNKEHMTTAANLSLFSLTYGCYFVMLMEFGRCKWMLMKRIVMAIAAMTVAVVVLLFLFRGVSRIFSESFRLFGFFAFRSCGAAMWALWLFGLQGLNLTITRSYEWVWKLLGNPVLQNCMLKLVLLRIQNIVRSFLPALLEYSRPSQIWNAQTQSI